MPRKHQQAMEEYRRRINRVTDHINQNLGGNLSLDELAGVAAFSSYHFHRIFRVLTGETPGEYIRRLRLQQAAHRLRYRRSRDIAEIAADLGFSSHSAFSRAFREHFGSSPSAWAGARGILEDSYHLFGLAYDDPDVTLPEKCRYDACVEVNDDIQSESAKLNMSYLNPGRYAVFPYEGGYDQLGELYTAIFGEWLPSSGFMPGDGPCFERYTSRHRIGPETLSCDILMPIQPL